MKLVISEKARSIPVDAVTIRSLALKDSEEIASPVSFCCLIFPDSEYIVRLELVASISFLISILLTASNIMFPEAFKM